MMVFVCPSSGVRGLAEAVRPFLRGQPLIVSAAKGVEQETRLTMSAVLQRVLAEITRLAIQLGADRQTLSGLSGLGDLVLTCTGDLSRNRTVGLRLGRGECLDEIVASMKEVAEGVRNTRSVRDLAQSVAVEMPITEQMYQLLYEAKPPRLVVIDLMTRGLNR